jgi:hypothetical protein
MGRIFFMTETTTPSTSADRDSNRDNPHRMMTISAYWTQFNEPIEHLTDPEATFRDDARRFVSTCLARQIHFDLPKGGLGEAAFPLWFLREQYPANP